MRESEQFQGARFDLCHGHDWLAAKAVVQCRNMGRSTVATIHSTEYGRCGNVNYGGQSERIRKIEEEVAYVAERVISVSGVLCDEVKMQFGINSDKLRMVYNGIHLAPYLGEHRSHRTTFMPWRGLRQSQYNPSRCLDLYTTPVDALISLPYHLP